MIIIKTYGRKRILANYTEEQLLSLDVKKQQEAIIHILRDTQYRSLHERNSKETQYLIDYVYGDQDIKFKTKKTRTDINNRSVENWAYACVDWKKSFLLGKPVQYAPINDVSNKEIQELNNYMSYEDKNSLDIDLWENVLICGRGYRYVMPTKVNEDDEAPFGLINLDPTKTEVVYSSSITREQLFGVTHTQMTTYIQEENEVSNIKKERKVDYDEMTVYLRNKMYVVNGKTWEISQPKTLIHNEHRIIEYSLNQKFMGLIEIAKDIFDDINNVENLDLDDMEQFVNSIMVFTNAEVNKASMDGIKEFGAVSIKSTEQRKASVEILQSRLKSLDTQIYYLRKIGALHSILSIPQATSDGQVNAETGKGMLTGQGFTSASVRIQNEELSFKHGDKKTLKIILKICKLNKDSIIKNLRISDVDTKLSRDLSDNLLVKSQALQTLASAGIPPEIRNQVVNLFSDPVSVTALMEKYEEERQDLQNKINNVNNNSNNKIKEQNNKVEDVLEIQNQEQF